MAYIALNEEDVHHNGRWKALGLTALLAGFGITVLLSGGNGLAEQTPVDTMVGASPMTRGVAMPVPAAMSILQSFGVRPNSMEELALTGIAATRDVSMRAQVPRVFSRMDPASQARVMTMTRDVKARALKLSEMPGITAPLGLWDPCGFSTDIPEGRLWFMREAELKHGRIAMLASLGIQVAEKFHPLWGDVPFNSAIEFHKEPLFRQQFWPAVLFAAGTIELLSGNIWDDNISRAPGDLGFDPLGLKPKNAKDLLELQNKELNNGRLAMFAAMGMMFQELIANTKPFVPA